MCYGSYFLSIMFFFKYVSIPPFDKKAPWNRIMDRTPRTFHGQNVLDFDCSSYKGQAIRKKEAKRKWCMLCISFDDSKYLISEWITMYQFKKSIIY